MDEKGEVVMVMEKRAVDHKREGYFIVQVGSYTPRSQPPMIPAVLVASGNPHKVVGPAVGGDH